ncbi:L,D-transpeptidase family protein [Candidatus Kaiserbacteria bacterium]|nr:L,D-transpeptidase family protein [Candidatus Kaiserbacteria bacterium]USN88675.1 MAG: L,D-transpeptidase family protein [Candidatus Nomurabacteria bacterium]
MKKITFLYMFFLLAFPCSTHASSDSFLISVNFKTATLFLSKAHQIIAAYPVVLPRATVQTRMRLTKVIYGEVTQVDYKPTWWPTENMLRHNPALPTAIPYGHPKHPIGLYRIRVHWINPENPSFWVPIRIHGGAKDQHLTGKFSSGCVRMKDEDISSLVEHIDSGEARVSIEILP